MVDFFLDHFVHKERIMKEIYGVGAVLAQIFTGVFVYEATGNKILGLAALSAVLSIYCAIMYIGYRIAPSR